MSDHTNAKKIMLVWNGWHQTLPITAPPTCVDGVLCVHVDDSAMREFLEAELGAERVSDTRLERIAKLEDENARLRAALTPPPEY